jgi:hypothetical protein
MTSSDYTISLEKRIAELEEMVSSFKKKMYIPTVGAIFDLTKDWKVSIHNDYRNSKFQDKVLGESDTGRRYNDPPTEITVPKGSRLKVKRIYVRQGKEEYDSVTFTLVKHATDKKIKASFWAKLNDVNKIEFDLVDGKGKIGE